MRRAEGLDEGELADAEHASRYGLGTELLLYLISVFVAPPVGGAALFVGLRLRQDPESHALATNILLLSLFSTALFVLVMFLAA